MTGALCGARAPACESAAASRETKTCALHGARAPARESAACRGPRGARATASAAASACRPWHGASQSRVHSRRAECNGTRRSADGRSPGGWNAGGERAREQPSGAQGGLLVGGLGQPASGSGTPSGGRVFDDAGMRGRVFDPAVGRGPVCDGAAERRHGGPARAACSGARADPAAASRLGPGQPAVCPCVLTSTPWSN